MSEEVTNRKPARRKIDPKIVEELAARGLSQDFIAHRLGVTKHVFEIRKYRSAYLRGKARLAEMICDKQLEVAMRGNPSLLIWLGRVHAGQNPSGKIEVTGDHGGPIRVDFRAYVEAVGRALGLTDETLESIRSLSETRGLPAPDSVDELPEAVDQRSEPPGDSS